MCVVLRPLLKIPDRNLFMFLVFFKCKSTVCEVTFELLCALYESLELFKYSMIFPALFYISNGFSSPLT